MMQGKSEPSDFMDAHRFGASVDMGSGCTVSSGKILRKKDWRPRKHLSQASATSEQSQKVFGLPINSPSQFLLSCLTSA
jgi:hypothetical protein